MGWVPVNASAVQIQAYCVPRREPVGIKQRWQAAVSHEVTVVAVVAAASRHLGNGDDALGDPAAQRRDRARLESMSRIRPPGRSTRFISARAAARTAAGISGNTVAARTRSKAWSGYGRRWVQFRAFDGGEPCGGAHHDALAGEVADQGLGGVWMPSAVQKLTCSMPSTPAAAAVSAIA